MITGAGDQPRFTFSEPGFEVLDFSGSEGLSELFEFQLELVTTATSLDWDELVGKTAQLAIAGAGGTTRYINGVIAELQLVANLPKRAICRALLVPPHVRLALKRKLRVFQDVTTQQIVTQVLQESGISALEWKLRESYKPRNYCVQYRETDLAFVSRLLEEEGIAYYFVHEQKALRTVFSDHNEAFQPIAGKAQVIYNVTTSMVADQEFVNAFVFGQQLRSGKVQLRDYTFKKPRLELKGEALGVDPTLEVYDYPGEFVEAGLGQRLATVRLQELEQEREVGQGSSNCLRLVPGFRFTLGGTGPGERHKRAELNQEYLLLRVSHQGHQGAVLGEEGEQGATQYSNGIVVIPAKVPFRPPRVTPRPAAMGTQTATVVGPKGEEIYVDAHGRVKLRFHWDRESKSTSWVRVSHAWAGAGFGNVFLPRVGQEVLVSFLEGDPDRPVVTGRVYNGEQVVPYDLPLNKTRSVLKSNSSPARSPSPDVTTGLVSVAYANAGSNELRLEDAVGHEEVFVHAERDYNVVVENDRTTQVRHDRIEAVKNDQHLKVGNNQMVSVTEGSIHMAKKVLIEATEHMWIEAAGTLIELMPSTLNMLAVDTLASATGVHDVRGGLVKINTAPPIPIGTGENWIDLCYQYFDGTGVAGAKYEIFDALTGALLASGTLDGEGKAKKVALPPDKRRVRVRYSDDPKKLELKPLEPHGLTPEGQPEEYLEHLATLDDIPD
jgi:type VI secretion system secreted protein VgrG